MTGTIGVAISTTGDEHRMGFLETCAGMWRAALPEGSPLFVTVDGSQRDAERVRGLLDGKWDVVIYRVGQPVGYERQLNYPSGRMGVAVNKNTGIELLMYSGVEHLFLCDDDTWPVSSTALNKHIELNIPHSLVCWGKSRLLGTKKFRVHGTGLTGAPVVADFAEWSWPRGVMLYAHRSVVETVGGMDERFGPGGHEHVEWSQRIHHAGLTPAPFVSPLVYSLRGVSGNPATRASTFWHCEDMRKPGETPVQWDARKKRNTSIRRTRRDWEHIDRVMAERQGSSDFVSYQAQANGRSSATLCSSSSCAVEPETPRSDS